MVIDLGILGDLVNARKFWGTLAIGFPIVTIGLFALYSMVRKIPFLKNIVQYILMTYGFSILLFIPVLFFSAFLEIEKLKLALIYLIILFFVSIFTLFNQRECVNFMKEVEKLRNSSSYKS